MRVALWVNATVRNARGDNGWSKMRSTELFILTVQRVHDNATSTGQIKPDQMIATLRGKQLESLARGRPLGTPMIWKHWDAAFVERKQWTAGADHAETYVAHDPCRDYAGQNERPCVPK